MTVRLLALSFLLLATTATHVQAAGLSDGKAQKAAVKCQKAIDQVGAKLVATKLKSLDACSTAVLACIQVKPGDAACLAKATAKCTKGLIDGIPQAQVGAVAKIVKSCGTPLRTADLLAADGLGIGVQAAACNTDFGLNVCSDLPTLAQCLVAEQARTAERVFATEQPRARELMLQVVSPLPLADLPGFTGCDDCSVAPSATLGKAVAACGAALTKTGRAFAGAVQKGLGSCIDKVFVCLQTKPGDAKCLVKAADGCDATVAKLAAARGKLAAGIDKRCAESTLLPFATLAAAAALNLDGLADDCAALGTGPLGSLDDYVSCVRRQHECGITDLLRRTLPRTSELVDAGLLGAAGDLLDPSACPPALPSDQFLTTGRAPQSRFVGTFSTARFLSMTKMTGNAGTKATTVSSSAPTSSTNALRRIAFPQGAPNRFVPGTSRIVKVAYGKPVLAKSARATAAVAPTMIVTVRRGDFIIDDHLEIPLDALGAGDEGEVDLAIEYDAAPPSCVFDLAFALSDGEEISDYTVAEQVSDTVPPPTATPAPVPTATPLATTTATLVQNATITPTPTGGGTKTPTPTATGPTPTATATPVFAYALTTTDDPTGPGGNPTFVLTVTNLTNAPQNATLSFTVPAFTFYGAFPAGAVRSVVFNAVAVGASQSAIINLAVNDGAQAPPDGTSITVTCSDTARGASVARTIVTQAAPPADLELATTAATVAPGGTFAYTAAYHNLQNGPLADVELSVAVPAGASFVAAEGGATPGLDGIVRVPLGTLAGNATGERTVTFQAAANTRAALVVEAALAAGNVPIATASAATVVYAAPTFGYTLTSIDDPVAPGGVATFRLTATNLTNAIQNTTLSFRVPDFTFYGAFGTGAVRSVAFANVAAGASESALLNLTVNNGATAPPDGSLITLELDDTARGAVAARTIVAQSAGAAALEITTTQPTVAPGGTFTYTLAYHNAHGGPLAGAELSVPVPAGTTFVAADTGVVPDADGVVRWPLTLAANASGERRVTFTADANAKAALLVEATLRDAAATILTQASAATAVYAAPTFAYTLTSTDDLVAPGDTATFRLTVTNLTNATQDATLSLRVPDFTFYGAFPPGSIRAVAFAGVAAGASESALINLTVNSGATAPPDGTLITLVLDDAARAADVSRTIVADSAPAAELHLATSQGTVAPGATFAYTVAFDNTQVGPLADAELSVPVPVGAIFDGAEDGVVPDASGVVRWPLGTLAGNTTGQRTVTFTAAADARAALLVEASLRDADGEIVTHASAATAVYASPAFAYTLTSTDDDPIKPGRTATFLLTVTNLTNATQDATLSLRVPDFTFYGAFPPGAIRPVAFAGVAAGASASALVSLTVNSGATAPPDGTVIGLALHDTARAASVSRTIVAQSAGRAELKLSTTAGTVAPSGAFTYTHAYHNAQAGPLTGVELALPVPVGATFLAASGGVTPGADGVVRFPLGTLAANAAGTVTIDLTANAGAHAPLLVEAILRDGTTQILAEASAHTAVYTTPTFSYALTTGNDPIAPGQTAGFLLKVTNLTNTSQSATLSFRVPDFTTYGAFQAGAVRSVAFGPLAAGASQETTINLLVVNGAGAPPSGTLIDLTTTDGQRGASVSRTIVVN